MSHKPQKPLTKKKQTTIKWTKDADNRILKIEKQIGKIEKNQKYNFAHSSLEEVFQNFLNSI